MKKEFDPNKQAEEAKKELEENPDIEKSAKEIIAKSRFIREADKDEIKNFLQGKKERSRFWDYLLIGAVIILGAGLVIALILTGQTFIL
jgi:hypothetical protein